MPNRGMKEEYVKHIGRISGESREALKGNTASIKGEYVQHIGRISGESREALKGNTASIKGEYVQHEGRINGEYMGYQNGIHVASMENKWGIKAVERITGVSRAE